MKQKSVTCLAAPGMLVIGVLFFGSTHECLAQLRTESTGRLQTFGNWSPPEQSSPTSREDLFPRAKSGYIGHQNSNERPLQSQKPSMLSEQPPRARPLQPMSSQNMIQGTFTQEPLREGKFATVNHHEASTAEGILPLPRVASSWQSQDVPKADLQTQTSWPSEIPDANTSSNSGGLVQSVQSGVKDAISGFQSEGGWGDRIAAVFGGGNVQLKKVFGSLAIVIGGYLGFVWLLKKFNLSTNRGIPTEVIEVVGSAPYGPKKSLQLVRLGSKLLLLMNSQDGTHPVGEITDAEEVEYLISLCKGKRSRASSSVTNAIQKFASKKKDDAVNAAKLLTPARSSSTECTFSATQLVQALQSLQNSNQQNTVFEA